MLPGGRSTFVEGALVPALPRLRQRLLRRRCGRRWEGAILPIPSQTLLHSHHTCQVLPLLAVGKEPYKAPSCPYPPRPSCTVSTYVRHCRC